MPTEFQDVGRGNMARRRFAQLYRTADAASCTDAERQHFLSMATFFPAKIAYGALTLRFGAFLRQVFFRMLHKQGGSCLFRPFQQCRHFG
jgi:hypothetical protein